MKKLPALNLRRTVNKWIFFSHNFCSINAEAASWSWKNSDVTQWRSPSVQITHNLLRHQERQFLPGTTLERKSRLRIAAPHVFYSDTNDRNHGFLIEISLIDPLHKHIETQFRLWQRPSKKLVKAVVSCYRRKPAGYYDALEFSGISLMPWNSRTCWWKEWNTAETSRYAMPTRSLWKYMANIWKI